MHQEITPAEALTPTPAARVDGEGVPADSKVDAFFDALTNGTARGLFAVQGTLETSARWLDARAKAVGGIATKLSA